MKRSELDDILARERDAVAHSDATIHHSRETVARAHQLIDATKAAIARARRRSRQGA